MDNERQQLVNDIKKLLVKLNYIILDSYINENSHSIDYEIITNENIIVLSIKFFYENGNSLFDEISIYNNNNLLLEVQINEKYNSIKIYEIVLSYFTKS